MNPKKKEEEEEEEEKEEKRGRKHNKKEAYPKQTNKQKPRSRVQTTVAKNHFGHIFASVLRRNQVRINQPK